MDTTSTRLRPLIGKTPWRSQGSPEDPREELCARQDVPYVCERGHQFAVTFAAEVAAPADWWCRCGKPAGLTVPEAGPTQHERRMAQVLQRRSRAEGEQLLADRLTERNPVQ